MLLISPQSFAEHAAPVLDWNIVAAACAIFLGTLFTTIWGWYRGRERIVKKDWENHPSASTSVVVPDEQVLRMIAGVTQEMRDRLIIHTHAVEDNTRAIDENTHAIEKLTLRS